jgi:hypothetical protein
MNYYCICSRIKLDLNDINVLFPHDFKKSNKEAYYQYQLLEGEKDIDKKMNSICNILDFNRYEDDEYIIFPPHSLEDLIDESYQMHNCARDYYKYIISLDSQIYFLRKKNEPNKSFVTIEVKNNDINMALGKYNRTIVDKKIINLIDMWKKSLVKISL